MKKYFVSSAAVLLVGLGISQNTLAASNYNQRLNTSLLTMAAHPERTGNPYRVLIVDGVRDVDVDAFLNSHFDIIQNVMFTSVIVTDKQGKPKRDKSSGGILTEEDGC